jgi:hypothetical protein
MNPKKYRKSGKVIFFLKYHIFHHGGRRFLQHASVQRSEWVSTALIIVGRSEAGRVRL